SLMENKMEIAQKSKKTISREAILLEHLRESLARGPIEIAPMGRFLFQARSDRGGHWAVMYKGPLERLSLCKEIVLANPEVITDSWLDAHKDKFDSNEDTMILKKEFKNLPYVGITPYRLIKRLGAEGSIQNVKGFVILFFAYSGPSLPANTCLPAALKALCN